MEKRNDTFHSSLIDFFANRRVYWYWIILFVTVTASILVFLVPTKAIPWVYFRYFFGSVFVLVIPGYSIVRALFVKRELDSIESFVLSFGLSLGLIPIIGLLLNYSPWGLGTVSITLSLLVITILFASVAVIRDNLVQNKTHLQKQVRLTKKQE